MENHSHTKGGPDEVFAIPVRENGKRKTFYTEALPFVPGHGVEVLGEPVRMVAAQSAPAGEREAFEAWAEDNGHYKFLESMFMAWEARAILPVVVPDALRAAVADEREAFCDGHCTWLDHHPMCARAAQQRTQAAGVPEGWRETVSMAIDLIQDLRQGTAVERRLRELLAAAPAQPAVQQEQHPDDQAVDRFAVAMKVKLAKSREKGRHGWQTASAAYLSGLLYRHMYKADPLDVANLAMMLHQNGQAIELPREARHDQPEAQRLREALQITRDTIDAQLEVIASRAHGNYLDKLPVVRSLKAHRARCDAALAASTGQEVES